MSRLYSKLTNLQKQLAAAKNEEDRELIEDEIADLEFEIEEEDSDKYSSYDDE